MEKKSSLLLNILMIIAGFMAAMVFQIILFIPTFGIFLCLLSWPVILLSILNNRNGKIRVFWSAFLARSVFGFLGILYVWYNLHMIIFFVWLFPEIALLEPVYRTETSKLEYLLQSEAAEVPDPFSNKKFPQLPDGTYYSVGPDLVDDQAIIIYDTTNGTVSTGDIIVGSRLKQEPE